MDKPGIQIRHLPRGVYWEICGAAPDTYQNGAYWATYSRLQCSLKMLMVYQDVQPFDVLAGTEFLTT